MNGKIMFGLALFFAVVGIAMLGGEKQAVAGHGCHGCGGCAGAVACDGFAGKCHGLQLRLPQRCHGGCGGVAADCGGRFQGFARCQGVARCHGVERCHGLRRSHGCEGAAAPACCGAAPAEAPTPAAAPAPAPKKEAVPEAPKAAGAPMLFHQVAFRR